MRFALCSCAKGEELIPQTWDMVYEKVSSPFSPDKPPCILTIIALPLLCDSVSAL